MSPAAKSPGARRKPARTATRSRSVRRNVAAGGGASRAPSQVEVRIDVPRAALPMTAVRLRAQMARAVALTGFRGRLSVAIVTDAAMRALNRDFHGCDEPTDVLAFALDRPPDARGDDGFDAEVILSLDTARIEAAERGVTLAAEVLLYLVHGTLHLMGEDDHDAVSYRRMHARALSILAALGEANTIDPAHRKLRNGRPR